MIRQGGFFVLSKEYSKLWRIEGKFNPLFFMDRTQTMFFTEYDFYRWQSGSGSFRTINTIKKF